MAKRRKDKSGVILKKGESQRANGTYMFRWVNAHGKNSCIYAKTLCELREKENEIFRELSMGISRKSITVEEQVGVYLELKTGLAASTKANYADYYNRVIKEHRFGKMKVIDVKKTDVLRFYKELADRGLSSGTIKIVHKILHPAFQLACDDDIIFKNPTDSCTRDYVEDVEKKYALTPKEVNEFLTRVLIRERTKRYYPMYAIMAHTGMRISEMVGLTWNDVDMEKREIHIDHQVQYRRIDGKTKFFAGDTKTAAGERVLLMSPEVHELFKEQRKEWFKINKDSSFEVDGYKDFVFLSHVTGRCMNQNNIRRMMRMIVSMNESREVQLPNVTPHIFRHTAITRMAERGCDVKVLQYLFGQTDIRTTMRVYNHVDSERVKREVERVGNLHNFTQEFTQIEQQVM